MWTGKHRKHHYYKSRLRIGLRPSFTHPTKRRLIFFIHIGLNPALPVFREKTIEKCSRLLVLYQFQCKSPALTHRCQQATQNKTLQGIVSASGWRKKQHVEGCVTHNGHERGNGFWVGHHAKRHDVYPNFYSHSLYYHILRERAGYVKWKT